MTARNSQYRGESGTNPSVFARGETVNQAPAATMIKEVRMSGPINRIKRRILPKTLFDLTDLFLNFTGYLFIGTLVPSASNSGLQSGELIVILLSILFFFLPSFGFSLILRLPLFLNLRSLLILLLPLLS